MITVYMVSPQVINIGMDMGAGYIPLFGTMIDVVFKANLANLAILEAHLRRTPKYVGSICPYPSNVHSFLSLGMRISRFPHHKLGGNRGSVGELQIKASQPQAGCRPLVCSAK
jgi:Domain of unknown function (DUF4112)